MPIGAGALSLVGQPAEGGSLETKGQINVIPTNGLKYFTFPSCIITQTNERWSLAQMTGSEIRLYFSICWLSNKRYTRTDNDFEVKVADLRRMSGLKSPKTFAKALEGLQLDRRLMQIWPSEKTSRNGESETIRLELCDPLTGNPIVRDSDPRNQPGNYRLKGRTKRPTLNVFDPEDIEKSICEANEQRGTAVTHRPNGELVMQCPFHPDDTPSLSANSQKNGCWYCHGCNRKGNVFELLAGLTGTAVGESILSLAATKGIEVEYQDPDRGATVYSYKTEDGKKILKEVITRIKDGQKTVTQRRPGPSGYGFINDADGVPPSLYHVELLQWASTVCIVEGEKDADTVTNLELGRWPQLVVGVTSGGSGSWKPEFAKRLTGKQVILMPDNDEPGERYAEAVEASLIAENIEYRRISFEGTGCKDISEYMAEHTVAELVELVGRDSLPLQLSIPTDPLLDEEISL